MNEEPYTDAVWHLRERIMTDEEIDEMVRRAEAWLSAESANELASDHEGAEEIRKQVRDRG